MDQAVSVELALWKKKTAMLKRKSIVGNLIVNLTAPEPAKAVRLTISNLVQCDYIMYTPKVNSISVVILSILLDNAHKSSVSYVDLYSVRSETQLPYHMSAEPTTKPH